MYKYNNYICILTYLGKFYLVVNANKVTFAQLKLELEMNKTIIKSAVLAMFMVVSTHANAQLNLGSLLDKAKSAVSGSKSSDTSESATGSLISGLTNILTGKKVPSVDNLAGTWTYVEPAVMFTSDNALKNAGGKLASSSIENQLQSKLSKVGITPGKVKMTFVKDGTFSMIVSGKTLKGKYAINDDKISLLFANQSKQIAGTTQLDGNSLVVVMDVSKLLSFAKTLGSMSGNSSLSALTSLAGSMDGMQCGLRLEKE